MGLRAANSNILLRTDLLAKAGYDVDTLDDVARTPGGLFELFRASHLAMNGGSEPILTNRRGIGPRGWIVSPIALQFWHLQPHLLQRGQPLRGTARP